MLAWERGESITRACPVPLLLLLARRTTRHLRTAGPGPGVSRIGKATGHCVLRGYGSLGQDAWETFAQGSPAASFS
ncbi:hypothetical protein BDV11DRAFT_6965 [Aspergillus similis]